MSANIVDRGVGPQIEGSRITVYDIVYERSYGLSAEEIAELFFLTKEQVEAALKYIEEHKEEVMAGYRRIQERHARGNPPELQAKIDAMHAKYAPMWAELRRKYDMENGDGRDSAGH